MSKIIKVCNCLILVFVLFIIGCNTHEEFKYFVDQNGDIAVEKYQEGKIVERISYLSDTTTKEGAATYYQNNSILKTEHWNNGKLSGSYLEYIKNKPSLFICFDSYGDTVFLRTFAGDKISHEEGNILPHGTLEIDHLYADSTVRYVSFIVKPPHVGIDVKNYLINLDNNDTIVPLKATEMYDWVNYSTFKVIKKVDISINKGLSLQIV
ncbi:MAG TPA: hypothetical protein VL098_08345 [Flavipsychrobacter sp.]|nr:hypothetical protein [Flavipsychrobacter sp.]